MRIRIIMAAGVLLVAVGAGIGAGVYLRSTNTAEPSGGAGVTHERTVAVTPDGTYSYGAFCRVNPLPDGDGFFVTFGGSNRDVQESATGSPFGGAEGGNGYSYKVYTDDFEFTGETGVIHSGGGDAASVMAGGYYYFLAGTPPDDWIVKKIDPSTWETVDFAVLDMDRPREILNDMMLAYANGTLIAGGLYDEAASAAGDQRKSDPLAGFATHNRIIDEDLVLLDRFVLDDVPHINGSYVVFANGLYHYVTSTAFFGDLIVMQYDEDWNFVRSKTLDAGAQWSQGAVYDETTDRFYVAYLDLPLTEENKIARDEAINVALGVYDGEWNLVETIDVTGFDVMDAKAPGRPSVILDGERLYVSYDVSTAARPGIEEALDWQCTVDVFDAGGS